MYIWFECKVRYEKTMENGLNKKVTEPYVVDAMSFTEAEGRIIEIISHYVSGEYTISDIKKANYSEGNSSLSTRRAGRRNAHRPICLCRHVTCATPSTR